jgi:hypothetical protein
MNAPWRIVILDALDALDRREAPHGLYGMRQAHSLNGRLPSLAHLLSARGNTDILRRNGYRTTVAPVDHRHLSFRTVEGERVSLGVIDYATIKVRKYGSSYRVDEGYTKKKPKKPEWELESCLSEFFTCEGCPFSHALLFVAHFRDPKEYRSLLGRSTEPEFLDRHELIHLARHWKDRYDRGFETAIHLWSSVPKYIEQVGAANP